MTETPLAELAFDRAWPPTQEELPMSQEIAEGERQRADQEWERAERLAAQLRDLGIKP